MKGRSALITSSLADADARVVITTSVEALSGCSSDSNRIVSLRQRVCRCACSWQHLAARAAAADQAGQVTATSTSPPPL